MATFPGAAEAVGAAVAIQQAVEGHNPPPAARRTHRAEPGRRDLGGDGLLRHPGHRGSAAVRGGRGRADPGGGPRAPHPRGAEAGTRSPRSGRSR
jgi:hypothetical protein